MEIDVRGLSCPEPVMKVQEHLGKESTIVVLLDSPTAKDNVKTIAEKNGYAVTLSEKDGDYVLTLKK